MRATFNPYLFNPVFWHIWEALHNPKIRRILVRGGSSASKTFSICDGINLLQLEQLKNVLALRKHRVHVDTTIKPSFESSINRLQGLEGYYDKMDGEIRVATGARTVYAGLDDPEKVKGLESFDLVYINELNQFFPDEWDEVNRRLRGRPGQKILADWNPIIKTHWINNEILVESEGWTDLPLSLPDYDRDFGAFTTLTPGYSFKKINAAGDTLWINVTYRDNFWIVGHPANTIRATPGDIAYKDADPTQPITLTKEMFIAPDGNLYGFIDTHTLANFEKMRTKKPNDYRIYGLGQDGLIKTGGEFWKQFDEEKHIKPTPLKFAHINPEEPIHISADNNSNPYVTSSFWAVNQEELSISQVHEIPSRSPNNTAFKAAMQVSDFLDRIKFESVVFVYGDPSANAKSTEDDQGRSFFDKYIATIEARGYRVISRVQRAAPGVAISAAFINDIYEGDLLPVNWKIYIFDCCTTSIEDYSLVKEAPDGTMLKEKVLDPTDPDKRRKIEKYGHFSDAKRYFLISLLFDLFTNYKQRRRTPRVMSVRE
jgi:phage terminase large subunit